jgi:thioredoxin reductase (NADPH)
LKTLRAEGTAPHPREQIVGTQNYEIVIVGAGPSGMTAGLYAGRSLLKTVVLERGAPGGELLNTEMIEDYPGFEHVEGWDLAQKFASHAAKFGCEFHTRNVVEIKRQDDGTFHTTCDDGEVYHSPVVIVTAGGTPIKLGIPGETEYAGCRTARCATGPSSRGT